ncbi:unnamed protein product [Ectocarpus sp. 8 AP-2014]
MAWGTAVQKKLRTALRGRAGQIFAERYPCASDELPLDGEELSSEQLESVTEEVFQEPGNMDQTPPSRGRCSGDNSGEARREGCSHQHKR